MEYVALGLLLINAWSLVLVAKYYICWKTDRARMAEYQAKYHNVAQELEELKARVPKRDSKGRYCKK